MSEKKINAAFRLMIIDIEEDKLILDEFCDAIIGGIAKEPTEGKKGLVMGNVLNAVKCGIPAGVAAVSAAEDAIEFHKKKTCKLFAEKIGLGDLDSMIDKILGGDDGAETGD